eukprot:6177674-Pleurochrysis_carterae.AAC.1
MANGQSAAQFMNTEAVEPEICFRPSRMEATVKPQSTSRLLDGSLGTKMNRAFGAEPASSAEKPASRETVCEAAVSITARDAACVAARTSSQSGS